MMSSEAVPIGHHDEHGVIVSSGPDPERLASGTAFCSAPTRANRKYRELRSRVDAESIVAMLMRRDVNRLSVVKISLERSFHNDRTAKIDVIPSKPAEFKVKLELCLKIANRQVRLYVARHT